MNKTKKRGGTNNKSVTYHTAYQSLAQQKIPEQIIESDVLSFLNDFDKARLLQGSKYTTIQDMEKYFKPSIHYHFLCDMVSYTEDTNPYAEQYFTLKNTRFQDNIKKRIDACVKYDAVQYLIDSHGENFDINAQTIDLTPKIDVNVIVSIRMKRNGQAVARNPWPDTEIVINDNPEKSKHDVAVYTDYGMIGADGTHYGDDRGLLLKNCKKLYAHYVMQKT